MNEPASDLNQTSPDKAHSRLIILIILCLVLLLGKYSPKLTSITATILQRNTGHTSSLRVAADLNSISAALQTYEMHALALPTTKQGLHALTEKPTMLPIPKNHMRVMAIVPSDPWGEPYKYRFPAEKSLKRYDIYSTGPDRQENTRDDMGNW